MNFRSEHSVRIMSVASLLCTSLMVRKLQTVFMRNCIYILEIDYDANELHLKGVTPEAVAELRKKLLETMNTKVQHVSGFIKLLRLKINKYIIDAIKFDCSDRIAIDECSR